MNQVGSTLVYSTTCSCLTELIQSVSMYFPTMDDFSKVYRVIRKNDGEYAGLFKFPHEEMKGRHVLVAIKEIL